MNILSEIYLPLKISQSAAKFLKSLDSLEPDLWQKFNNCSMTNPSQILKDELSRVSPWQCLQHGDSWHNNFLLNEIDVHVVDWQVLKNSGALPWIWLRGIILGYTKLGGVQKLRLQNLAFFDHLTPSVYIFYGIKVYKKSLFLTTYPPPLVNVVCERPLTWNHRF